MKDYFPPPEESPEESPVEAAAGAFAAGQNPSTVPLD